MTEHKQDIYGEDWDDFKAQGHTEGQDCPCHPFLWMQYRVGEGIWIHRDFNNPEELPPPEVLVEALRDWLLDQQE